MVGQGKADMPDSDPVPDIIPADADLMSAKLRSLRGSMEVVAAEMLWRERPVVLLCLPHLTTGQNLTRLSSRLPKAMSLTLAWSRCPVSDTPIRFVESCRCLC